MEMQAMNRARFVTASVAAFVAIAVVNFVVHGVVLSGIYQQAASAFRKEADAQRHFWLFSAISSSRSSSRSSTRRATSRTAAGSGRAYGSG